MRCVVPTAKSSTPGSMKDDGEQTIYTAQMAVYLGAD